MSIQSGLTIPEKIDESIVLPSKLLTSEVLTPLTGRVASNQPELILGLEKLKLMMEPQDFSKYIERLDSIKLNRGTLWLTARYQMERSMLERNYLSHLKQAFDVKCVRVICV